MLGPVSAAAGKSCRWLKGVCHKNGKQYLHGELQELKAKGVSTRAGSGREIVYDLMCSFYLNDSATVLKNCGEDEVAMWSQRENEDEKLA